MDSLYLVMGGEMQDFDNCKFTNPEKIEVIGVFATYDEAYKAWRGRSLETVDNALQRYCILALDSALQPVRTE